MTLIYEKKIPAEVQLIHAEQMSLYNFIILRKKQWTQMKTKYFKQDILNQYESMGFPKLWRHKVDGNPKVIRKTGRRYQISKCLDTTNSIAFIWLVTVRICTKFQGICNFLIFCNFHSSWNIQKVLMSNILLS